MLLFVCMFFLAIPASLNHCAASDDHFFPYYLEQQKQLRNIELTTVTVSNRTSKLVTLTFRVLFSPCCEMHRAMCKLSVEQKLQAKTKQKIVIPKTWETLDISSPSEVPALFEIAGLVTTVSWIHHGTYKEKDLSDPPGKLTFKESSAQEISLYKSGRPVTISLSDAKM